MQRAVFLILLIATLPERSLAAAPPQLLNKTVELFWGESFVTKRVSDGGSSTGVGQKSRMIYISSAGRAFVRTTDTSGRYGHTKEKGPENTKGTVSFAGTELSLVSVNQQIARRVIVSFDPSFATCSATLSVGKASANARATGYDGSDYEVVSISGGSVRCSVKQGNAIAGQ